MEAILHQKQAIKEHIKAVDAAIAECNSGPDAGCILDLSDMRITNERLCTLMPRLHMECPDITDLRLGGNFLQLFPVDGLLGGFGSLQSIELNDNPITTVKWASICEHPQLDGLDLQYCALSQLVTDMAGLRDSFMLYLYGNEQLKSQRMSQVHKCQEADQMADIEKIKLWCAEQPEIAVLDLQRESGRKFGLKLRKEAENGDIVIDQVHPESIAFCSVTVGDQVLRVNQAYTIDQMLEELKTEQHVEMEIVSTKQRKATPPSETSWLVKLQKTGPQVKFGLTLEQNQQGAVKVRSLSANGAAASVGVINPGNQVIRVKSARSGGAWFQPHWVSTYNEMVGLLQEESCIELELSTKCIDEQGSRVITGQHEAKVGDRVLPVESTRGMRGPAHWLRVLKGASLAASDSCYAKLRYRGCKYTTDDAVADQAGETLWNASFMVPIWNADDLDGMCVEVLERCAVGAKKTIGKIFLSAADVAKSGASNGSWVQLVGEHAVRGDPVVDQLGSVQIWLGGLNDSECLI